MKTALAGALVLVLLAPTSLARSLDAPRLAVGDAWTFEQTVPWDQTPRTRAFDVRALEPVMAGGASYQSARIVGPDGDTEWVRLVDGAKLRTIAAPRQDGRVPPDLLDDRGRLREWTHERQRAEHMRENAPSDLSLARARKAS